MSKEAAFNKFINNFLRQKLFDYNVNNNNEKSNSDEKRVQEITIEADFRKNRMQEIKFIIIEVISEFFLSTEIIHASKS